MATFLVPPHCRNGWNDKGIISSERHADGNNRSLVVTPYDVCHQQKYTLGGVVRQSRPSAGWLHCWRQIQANVRPARNLKSALAFKCLNDKKANERVTKTKRKIYYPRK